MVSNSPTDMKSASTIHIATSVLLIHFEQYEKSLTRLRKHFTEEDRDSLYNV